LPPGDRLSYARHNACYAALVDLQDSGTTQPCYTRNGSWYFKFAQNF
jgi:hypothetical protein